MAVSVEDKESIENLIEHAHKSESLVHLDFPGLPKWQLLSVLADDFGFMLHGTGDPTIIEFTPRQPKDSNPFGAQNAVYAASDGIWPIFYAILDRNPPFSLHNACIRLVDEDGIESEPKFFFSIERSALERRPFRKGYVYV